MTARELVRLKKVLANELDAVARAARQGRECIAIEQSAEAFEQLCHDNDRELAMADLSRRADQVRQIRAALVRMENGTFGVCQYCRKAIPPKRLNAVPWTRFCIQCQETADRQGMEVPDFTAKTQASAA